MADLDDIVRGLTKGGEAMVARFSPGESIAYDDLQFSTRVQLFRAGLLIGGQVVAGSRKPGCKLSALGYEVRARLLSSSGEG